MSSDNNINFCTLIFGTNGTGKTTLTNEIIAPAKNLLAVVPDGFSENYKSFKEVGINEIGERGKTKINVFKSGLDFSTIADTIYENYHNGTIIFEDARSYINFNVSAPVNRLLVRRRQKNINVISVFHGFSGVPLPFFIYYTHLYLFHTTDNPGYKKNRIPLFDRIMKRKDYLAGLKEKRFKYFVITNF